MRIGLIVGTRPEIIKTWSVIEEIKSRKDIDLVLIHTGQHYDYEMSKVFFEDLSIRQPDYYLEVGSHP
ncbi:MAG: UDP-N-acetylglucosamine 2-epimerase, partial [Candidatus Thorarchaeota archaeon]